jgi:hypothetical protein
LLALGNIRERYVHGQQGREEESGLCCRALPYRPFTLWMGIPMSLRRASLCVALFALGVLSACALRPRYSELVQPEGSSQKAVDGQTLTMRMVDPATGQPIKGAKVLSGSGRSRLAVTSDDEGRITVPVAQSLLEENPLLEVVLPKGVKAYQFQVFRPVEKPATDVVDSVVAPGPEETGSTGSVAPNSTTSPETPPVSPPTPPTSPTPNAGDK